MKKRGVTKDTLSLTINIDLLKKFNDFCEKNAINKSKLIENYIKKYLEEKK